MSGSFTTDAGHSTLKPAGPHLLERSSDAPAQTLSRTKVTVHKPYAAVVTIVSPAAAPSPDAQGK